MGQRGFTSIVLLLGFLLLAGGAIYELKTNPDLSSKVSSSINLNNPTLLSSSSKLRGDILIISGKYSLGNNRSLEYSLNIPKNGGSLDGTISGICNGKIRGTADSTDKNGESIITGSLDGDCNPFSGFPFKAKLAGTFDGKVLFFQNKITLNYTITQPIGAHSSIEIPFSGGISTNTNTVAANSAESPIEVTSDQVTFSGKFLIPDKDFVNYSISFPRQGGAIIGKGYGTCEVDISGNEGTLDKDGKRPVSGTIEATCKPIIQLSYKTSLSGTFWGVLDDQNGKIQITHNGIFDQNSNSYLEASYIPN